MLDCVYVRALRFENYFYFKENANEVLGPALTKSAYYEGILNRKSTKNQWRYIKLSLSKWETVLNTPKLMILVCTFRFIYKLWNDFEYVQLYLWLYKYYVQIFPLQTKIVF